MRTVDEIRRDIFRSDSLPIDESIAAKKELLAEATALYAHEVGKAKAFGDLLAEWKRQAVACGLIPPRDAGDG